MKRPTIHLFIAILVAALSLLPTVATATVYSVYEYYEGLPADYKPASDAGGYNLKITRPDVTGTPATYTLSSPPITIGSVVYACVGWKDGIGFTTNAASTSDNITININGDVSITWLYKPGFKVTLDAVGTTGLWGWGNNEYGQLGNSTTSPVSGISKISGFAEEWVNVAVSRYHTVALKHDGSLWAWGRNERGQLGDGSTTDRSTPVQIMPGGRFIDVGASSGASAAVRVDGTLWTWGYAGLGQLGDGATADRLSPAQVGTATDWATVEGGWDNFIAIKNDQSIYAWGLNDQGQLGINSTENSSTPRYAGAGVRIAAGAYHSAHINSTNNLWMTGLNDRGQLGNGSTATRSGWVNTGSGYQSVAVGTHHTLAIKTDGSLWSWGEDDDTRLCYSQGGNINQTTPKRVGTDTDWVAIAAGDTSSLLVKEDGSVYGCGTGYFSGTSQGTYSTPTFLGYTWRSVVSAPTRAGGETVMLLGSDTATSLWGGGNDSDGSLGNIDEAHSYNLIEIRRGGFNDYLKVSEAYAHSVALRADGSLWSWGLNNYGQVGDGKNTRVETPVRIGGQLLFRDVAAGHSSNVAIGSDGALYTWGNNSFGQLGDGTTTERWPPTRLDSQGVDWRSVSGGWDAAYAIKNDGTLWSWGEDDNGRLGYSQPGNQPTPKQVGTDNDWREVIGGVNRAAGIKTDGSLWLWGYNDWGMIGDGTTTDVLAPKQIMVGSRWKAVALGFAHTLAVREDGTLWAWGHKDNHRLGNDSTGAPNQLTPIQVGSDRDWRSVAAGDRGSAAIKENGKLYVWGLGPWGGSTNAQTERNTPTLYGTDSDWLQVAMSWNRGNSFETLHAIRAKSRIEVEPYRGTRVVGQGEALRVTARAIPTDGSSPYLLGYWTDGRGSVPVNGVLPWADITVGGDTAMNWLKIQPGNVQTVTVGFASGVPEEVQSAAGFMPKRGDTAFGGGQVTLSAPASVTLQNGDVWDCFGWTGSGNVPGSGTLATVTFTLGARSAIYWKYQKRPASVTFKFAVPTGEDVGNADADFQLFEQSNTPGDWDRVSFTGNTKSFSNGTSIKLSVRKSIVKNDKVWYCTGISNNTATYKLPIVSSETEDRREFTLTLNDSNYDPSNPKSWTLDVNVTYAKATRVAMGTALTVPDKCLASPGALSERIKLVTGGSSADTAENVFFWSGNSVYPVRPINLFTLKCDTNEVLNYFADWGGIDQDNVVVGVPVNLAPTSSPYTPKAIHYSESFAAEQWSIGDAALFQPAKAGRSLIRFERSGATTPTFLTVRAVPFASPSTTETATIGEEIVATSSQHDDPEGKNGYVYYEKARYDGSGAEAAYDRSARRGQIIPVNTNVSNSDDRRLIVAWYGRGTTGAAAQIGWPTNDRMVLYTPTWPTVPAERQIELAKGSAGRKLTTVEQSGSIYHQPDDNTAGYKPNAEHAFIQGDEIHALRTDLSEPDRVLLKYRDPATQKWKFTIFSVTEGNFTYPATAGQLIQPPAALRLLPPSDQSRHKPEDSLGAAWYHLDHKDGHWAKASPCSTAGPSCTMSARRRMLSIANFRSDYQVQITIPYDPDMRSDFADLRFVDMTTLSQLPHVIESKVDGVRAVVWFRTGANNNISLVYGDSAVVSANANGVFEFFDDFTGAGIDSSRWTVDSASGFTVAGGVLRGTNSSGRLTSVPRFGAGSVLEVKANVATRAGNGQTMAGFFTTTTNNIGILDHPGNSFYRNNGNWTAFSSVLSSGDYLYRLTVVNGSQVRMEVRNFASGVPVINETTASNAVDNEPIAIGKRYDDAFTGQTYEASWDWIRVRKAPATPDVAISLGDEQSYYSPIVMQWYYPLQPSFWYPFKDQDGAAVQVGAAVPFQNGGRNHTDPPRDVLFNVSWPTNVPVLKIGETLTTAKNGLPAVASMAAVQKIYGDESIKLFAPYSERSVKFASLPADITVESRGGRNIFTALPHVLRSRLSHDPTAGLLTFKGLSIDMGTGEPLLLANIMSARERDAILALSNDAGWRSAVEALYREASLPYTATGIGVPQALTAGYAQSSGYVVLAENDHDDLGAAPVALHVIKVEGGPYRGEIKVLESDNPFDERLTLRHSGDFAGRTDSVYFSWYYRPDSDGVPPRFPDDPTGWTHFKSGKGLNDITIEGAGKLTLEDNWFIVRYYYGDDPATSGADPVYPPLATAVQPAGATQIAQTTSNWSPWAGAPGDETAQLAEGWIKRVVGDLNPLDARVSDFRNNATNTTVSMLSQLGERYEGAIALNGSAENLNNIGLIGAYHTVLDRGASMTIDSATPVDSPATFNALLNAATRISDFYTLLGNEAYDDAQDPTVAFDSAASGTGNMASNLFAFQNQTASLLEEELSLLRGRDGSIATTQAAPVYNRLIWNLTNGDGELAYVLTYNVDDDNGDGFVDEADAKQRYPQGHGDAWGHYLTAMTGWYDLLRHPHYSWEPRIESVLVGSSPVPVDYLDERKFARTAAYKAQTGAEIVDLTYRERYVDDPTGQWQGYKDNAVDTRNGGNARRAWGVDDWARRAGQAAYFDWVTGNALLPASDTVHTGIQKIDRTTVIELNEIAGDFQMIQLKADQADAGYNPLGLARGVVPFDIDPNLIATGQTHFEQIYDRAIGAMENAAKVYDYAANHARALRNNEDSLADFRMQTEQRETDFQNRLIEIFGYPYSGDIGAGKTYPEGYQGPDIFHYNYMDVPKLIGIDGAEIGSSSVVATARFSLSRFDGLLSFDNDVIDVEFPMRTDMPWKFDIPSGWGERRAPGEVQQALADLLKADADYRSALDDYAGAVEAIEETANQLEARFGVQKEKIRITFDKYDTVTTLGSLKLVADELKDSFSILADAVGGLGDDIADSFPKVVGVAADPSGPARGVVKMSGGFAQAVLKTNELAATITANALEFGISQTEREADLQMTVADVRAEVQGMVWELENSVGEAQGLILPMYRQYEVMQQALGRYRAALAKGERLLDERETFRKRVAGEVQDYRYQDLAFRTFRNEAVQKYRASFDLAARYAYLAATAYDYETNLLRSDRDSGSQFLTEIVKQRSPGVVSSGKAMVGTAGLADPMARLYQNFGVYKTQLGFNNPQIETSPFSLRTELFRIRPDLTSDPVWRNELRKYYVADLNSRESFKRFCRPFSADTSISQPGLIIPFTTEIRAGKNFFGFPLGSGDSSYDPSHFSTKIRSIGLWYKGYEKAGLSGTPRAYLVPAGADVLRSPTGDGFAERNWTVVDQKLPVPFPLSTDEIASGNFIPGHDSLSEDFGGIRKFSSFRAYADSGFSGLTATQATQMNTDSRLVGRSVWNTQWLLIIPGGYMLSDPKQGVDNFINNVSDIRLFFQTYSFSGN